MPKHSVNLKLPFKPTVYRLADDDESCQLTIEGLKLGPPNKRITLNQKGLKIISAKITYYQKNKVVEHQIARINHLPTFEEVRLHTSTPLYPGNYVVTLEFRPFDPQKLKSLENTDLSVIALRGLFPSFDNEEARTAVKIEFTN